MTGVSTTESSEESSADDGIYASGLGFCRDVIGRQNVKVVVIGRLLFCYYFLSIYCLSVLFEVMYESFVRCRQLLTSVQWFLF